MAFLDENFLLKTPAARILYHDYAADMPILDYHCHLSPKEIYENRSFSNIAQVWLGGDHYKWRLLRAGGVEEKYITGDASDREKFQKYAEVLSRAIGNPLYHWSHWSSSATSALTASSARTPPSRSGTCAGKSCRARTCAPAP